MKPEGQHKPSVWLCGSSWFSKNCLLHSLPLLPSLLPQLLLLSCRWCSKKRASTAVDVHRQQNAQSTICSLFCPVVLTSVEFRWRKYMPRLAQSITGYCAAADLWCLSSLSLQKVQRKRAYETVKTCASHRLQLHSCAVVTHTTAKLSLMVLLRLVRIGHLLPRSIQTLPIPYAEAQQKCDAKHK